LRKLREISQRSKEKGEKNIAEFAFKRKDKEGITPF